MNIDARTLLALGLIAAGFLLPGGQTQPVTPPANPPAISVDLPVAEIPAARREYLGDIYAAMADVIERDGKRADSGIDTIMDFTAFHAGALQLAVDREQVGVYPGLGEAIDAAFKANLGDENRPVDAAVRAKLQEVCEGVAWEFKHGS